MTPATNADTFPRTERMAAALAAWLPEQRWYGGKGREIRRIEVVRAVEFADEFEKDGARGLLTIVAVHYADECHLYQVPLGFRRVLPTELEPALIDTDDGVAVYDAPADHDLNSALLRLIARNHERHDIRFGLEPGGEHAFAARRGMPSRPAGVEQSNTSIVFADRYVMKLFRRLVTGINPDLELHRALSQAGSTNIAPLLGAIEAELAGAPVTLATLHSFASNAVDGWELACQDVRNLLTGPERAAGVWTDEHGDPCATKEPRDLRAQEGRRREQARERRAERGHVAESGDFAGECLRLGAAVAGMHTGLAAVLGARRMSAVDVQRLREGFLARLEAAVKEVPELSPARSRLRAAFAAVTGSRPEQTLLQRVHGDLHLGQVLHTPTRWLVIDFEGEPSASLAERTAPHSPLRDVAGMLRSFDYAAAHELRAGGHSPTGKEARIAARWTDRMRNAFLRGYATAAGTDPRAQSALLTAYELDKAVYEVIYETRNRPTWVDVPLRSVFRIAGVEEGEDR
ncbi:maltokinase N-terminal cap-like domain-containing protein [Actinophytocola sp.]|uniref:maltokinase N-terminal cap-like domain-containing protein n=1 Tax=Actinophytocola sp. TaxID=1872138 RepID=UPI002ED27FAB